jgi:hypothetical protein
MLSKKRKKNRKIPLTYLQNLHISKIPLRKPRPRHNRQLFSQSPKLARPVCERNDSLLHRAARHILALEQQFRRIQLLRATYAENRTFLCAFLMPFVYQREVAELFLERMRAVRQRHVRYQTPVIVFGWVAAGRCADPVFYFGATGVVEVDDTDEGCEG